MKAEKPSLYEGKKSITTNNFFQGVVFLLDESPPILAVLIIDGGHLIWDRKHGIELRAEYIIVNNHGSLEVGREDDLFCHPSGDRSIPFDAKITLYGHQR